MQRIDDRPRLREMHVFLAWFSSRPSTPDFPGAYEESTRRLVPDTYELYEYGGADWGVVMLHPGRNPSTRWEAVVSDGRITGLSLGVPVGAGRRETSLSMARGLLAGESIHRDVVPPFGLVAIDAAGRFAAQQDWLGQCRLFIGESDGVTMLCSRPSMLSEILYGRVEPDLDGWTSYVASGHFGGDMSPIRDVRLLSPGERLTGRRDDGGWKISSRIGHNVDDVVRAGLESRGRSPETSLTEATEKFRAVAGHITDRYDDLVLGLSGGKDSRLIAASLVAAGRVPRLSTNDDNAAEGETATELVRLLRENRGLTIDHTVRHAAPPAKVFLEGLRERIERLQHRYDYQFPSSYTVRPALAELLPVRAAWANITGAGGELATGYWHARTDPIDNLIVDETGIAPDAVRRERERVLKVLERGRDIGVEGAHLSDYLYLVERVRRWYSSAYSLSMITPFLHPEMVTVMFSLSAEEKRGKLLHTGLTERLVPEWAGIPYVKNYSPRSTVPKVWDGDGLEVIADLIDTAQGPIAKLLDAGVAERMLIERAGMARRDLQRFAYVAVASQRLEPHTVLPSTGATHRRVTAAANRSPSRIVGWMRWIKRTRIGRAVWANVRTLVWKK